MPIEFDDPQTQASISRSLLYRSQHQRFAPMRTQMGNCKAHPAKGGERELFASERINCARRLILRVIHQTGHYCNLRFSGSTNHDYIAFVHQSCRHSPSQGHTGSYSAICGHIRPYWIILDHTGLYWAILDYTEPYWATLGHIGSYWTILANIGPCWTVLIYTGPYWPILDHAGSYSIILGHI